MQWSARFTGEEDLAPASTVSPPGTYPLLSV